MGSADSCFYTRFSVVPLRLQKVSLERNFWCKMPTSELPAMTTLPSLQSLCRLVLLAALFTTCGVACAETGTVTARSLPDAVDKLEATYNVPITFEDAPLKRQEIERNVNGFSFTYEAPSSDATPAVSNDLATAAEAQRRRGYPLNDQVRLDLLKALAADPTLEVRKTLAAKALAEMLRQYDAAYGTEMFTVTEDDGGFHIVPIRYVTK